MLLVLIGLVTVSVLLAYTLVTQVSGKQCYYEAEVVMERIPVGQPPSFFLNLSEEELLEYPLINQVLEAYHTPSTYGPARMEDGRLYYPVPIPPGALGNITLLTTNDYLVNQWGARRYPLVLTTGSGEFYTWEVLVSDPGWDAPCP